MDKYEPVAFSALWTPADTACKKQSQKPSNLGKILTTASPPLGLVLILLTGNPIEKSPVLI